VLPAAEKVEAIAAAEGLACSREPDTVVPGCRCNATLRCRRAVLSWHGLHGRPDLLAHVRRLSDTYLRVAYTEQRHIWDWFGRPTWTEPCADGWPASVMGEHLTKSSLGVTLGELNVRSYREQRSERR
jgi:hypothetical protein